MDQELTPQLLLYIVDQLQDMGAPISTIRLVKFLYLIDLDHYNQSYQTLTGINWVKYDYGPYFFDWPDLVRSVSLDLEIEEVMTERGAGVTYRTIEEQDIPNVSYAIKVMVDRVLKQWAYEDTSILLENVYETMPVKHGEYCEPLDFTLETDHLLLEWARENEDDFVTLDELLTELDVQIDEPK